jgi:hypothetical protein
MIKMIDSKSKNRKWTFVEDGVRDRAVWSCSIGLERQWRQFDQESFASLGSFPMSSRGRFWQLRKGSCRLVGRNESK